MSKVTRIAVVAIVSNILGFGIAYSSFAFIGWEPNAMNWTTETRFVCLFLSLIIVGIIMFTVLTEAIDNNEM